MDLDDIKKKYLNKSFLTYYAIIFVLLYIFFSFIKFLGQLPVLLIITFIVTYYVTDKFKTSTQSNLQYENKIPNQNQNTQFHSITQNIKQDPIQIEIKEQDIIIGNDSLHNSTSLSPLGYKSFS